MSAVSGPVGILALQGDFGAHAKLLEGSGIASCEVRTADDLEGISGLLLPGGETTTIAMGLEREGLSGPIRELSEAGLPVFGTCAGLVLMGRDHLGLIDMEVERNAFGRQIHSFEADMVFPEIEGPPLRALFIRAPKVLSVGPDVEILAEIDGAIVAVRQRNRTAISFHPELIGDPRIHLSALLRQTATSGDQPA